MERPSGWGEMSWRESILRSCLRSGQRTTTRNARKADCTRVHIEKRDKTPRGGSDRVDRWPCLHTRYAPRHARQWSTSGSLPPYRGFSNAEQSPIGRRMSSALSSLLSRQAFPILCTQYCTAWTSSLAWAHFVPGRLYPRFLPPASELVLTGTTASPPQADGRRRSHEEIHTQFHRPSGSLLALQKTGLAIVPQTIAPHQSSPRVSARARFSRVGAQASTINTLHSFSLPVHSFCRVNCVVGTDI